MSGGNGGKLTNQKVLSFIQSAEPGKKLADGGGLYLLILPSGNPTWQIKYRIDKKEKTYSIGPYPTLTLAVARAELRQAKALIKEGKDPVMNRRINKATTIASSENDFKAIASLWLSKQQPDWSVDHFKKSARALERDVYPFLGKLPISEITAAIVAKVLEDIDKRGVRETADRISQHMNGIFKYAQAKALCRDNPVPAAREILPRKKISKHMPALLEWTELGDVLRRADTARLSPSVRMAHRLLAFSSARIGNVVDAEWKEFDLYSEQPLWVIPREKLKVSVRPIDLRIPLSHEITEELKRWQTMTTAKGYVFPSPTGGKHIGRESIEKVYRVTLALAGKHAPHGWRSSFSTLARDNGFARDVVELALDHANDNEVARAYDRGERFNERIKLFNWWGKSLAQAQLGAKIIPFNKAA